MKIHLVTRHWLQKLLDAPHGALYARDVPFAVHEDLIKNGWSRTEAAHGYVWESITPAGKKALIDSD